MGGTLFAIGEILVFLIAATVIGFFIGRSFRMAAKPRTRKLPDRNVAELETRSLILQGQLAESTEKLAEAMAEARMLRSRLGATVDRSG